MVIKYMVFISFFPVINRHGTKKTGLYTYVSSSLKVPSTYTVPPYYCSL